MGLEHIKNFTLISNSELLGTGSKHAVNDTVGIMAGTYTFTFTFTQAIGI